MTKEELRNKADDLAIKELYFLMKEKHYRDGFSDGYTTGVTDICKKIVEEVRTHEGIEQMTKFYIEEIVKNLGVDTDD